MSGQVDVRQRLDRLIRDSGEDYASISRMLGRNAAYIQQFLKRGTPRRLSEDDRHALATYFRVPEEQLGGRPSCSRTVPIRVIRMDRLGEAISRGFE